MHDIRHRQDIEELVNSFYTKVLGDPVIGHFFTEVVQLDLQKHMPVMYSFWETVLLGKMSYKGNPMIKHIELSQKAPITNDHLDRWLHLWHETVQEKFSGEKADMAVERARSIGLLMLHKIRVSAN